MKELLALAIWFKMQHSNSVIWNVTEYKLRKGLRIGRPKAQRLIQDMKDSDLFTIDGNKVYDGYSTCGTPAFTLE